MKKMNSINETAKLCKENEIGISRKLLLKLANEGAIPCIRTGRTILVNWDGLMNYLNTNTIHAEPSKETIRKISA